MLSMKVCEYGQVNIARRPGHYLGIMLLPDLILFRRSQPGTFGSYELWLRLQARSLASYVDKRRVKIHGRSKND
jgi:hypothetical protein